VLVARREDRLRALQTELGGEEVAAILPRDLATREGAASLIRDLETRGLEIDLLVNNAGFGLATPFLEQPLERLHEMVDLNVRAVLELTRGLLPPMVKRGRGAVINLSRIAAFQPVPYMAVYAATKSFILSLTEALAYETRGTGVYLQALCPGPTATEFLEVSKTHSGLFVRRMPMLTPEQVVEASLRGLEGRKRRVIPGFANRVVDGLVRLTPRGLTQIVTAELFKPR
jgi:short-subunit dehydrogenase